MKTKYAFLALVFVFGTVVSAFAGSHSALTYPAGTVVTAGTMSNEKAGLSDKRVVCCPLCKKNVEKDMGKK